MEQTATVAVREYVRAHRNREYIGQPPVLRSKPLAQIAEELNLTQAQVSEGLRAGQWFTALDDAERTKKPAPKTPAKTNGRPTRHQPKFNPHGWRDE